MASKCYIKLPFIILDDPRVGKLSDSDWRKHIEGLFDNPDNLFYDYHPIRYEYVRNWQKIRDVIFGRDKNKCRYCGSTKRLEIDHIRPISKGGSNKFSNMQILCKKCNIAKGSSYGE